MMMTLSSKVLGALVAVAILSACGGAVSPSAPVANVPQANAKGALAYVSDGSSSVYVYSYPQLQPAGKLSGFGQPEGLCADAAGDVWVADYGAQKVEEFAHGAVKPKATLKLDDYQSPFACSVDRKTGDLAVTAWRGNTGPGYLNIFKKAAGKAKTLTDSAFWYMDAVAYDPKGNLFVDGSFGASNKFEFVELKSGAGKFTPISISQHIKFPGGVQYDGKYIVVGDAEAAKIYATSGKNVVRTTVLTGAGTVNGFFIDGGAVICADSATIAIYKYPAGGTATLSISASNSPSVVISQ
jgi:hypothetical protein